MAITIGVLVILVILNGFFAASEIALISLNEKKVKHMAEDGDKKAKKLHNLISAPSRFLATIQVGITFAGFLASALASNFFAAPLAQSLYKMGVPVSQGILETIALVTITVILSYFTLVFGELVPKQLALQKAEFISNIAATPLTLLFKIAFPIVKLLTFSTDNTVKLFKLDPNADSEQATEEEIRTMVDQGEEEGRIQKTEKLMIKNVFEFNDKTASDIKTHRTDMSVLSLNATKNEVMELARDKKYTRFPVYDNGIDNIVGTLHVKDLIKHMDFCDGEKLNLNEVIRKPPYFVMEKQNVDELFRDMQQKNEHIAIVLDEYGGTEGIITIEDVIEEIVGEIFSENGTPEITEEELKMINRHKYRIAGIINLYQLEDILELDLPTEQFDTLNGFLIDQLGYVPSEDERPTINFKHVQFEVTEIADLRIQQVIATIESNESNDKMTDNN
ncbi:hemolysin family protein [Virgibacillus sp. DJP39]|uniref:hemolysin family protein n=1 Tax=Virgibacillus sp. DJP39 TaxID=3409790 RepID=UPI003BB54106